MPNLYITNNNTKTVMGLTPEKKTTPSLVVTCGTTTYYGSLTTCADWATEPNKIVVTSGSTTYYTMAPALGTKYVNFITPTECKAIEGTVMAKCCSGIAGYKDRLRSSNIGTVSETDHGSIGPSTLQQIDIGCVKALVYNSPDTTIYHCYLYYPPLNHTHSTSQVFDDGMQYGTMSVKTRHKGVRVCNNYNTSPDFIYVGCGLSSVTRGNLNYDFLHINRGDSNIQRSVVCMPFTCYNSGGTWSSGNVSSSDSTSLEFSDIATGPINTAVGLDTSRCFSVTHTHFADIPYNTSTWDYLVGCYCSGWGLPWFGVNMKCYDNDIDKLPQGSILFTDCDISCFDSRCWQKICLSKSLKFVLDGITCDMYYETFPYVNGTFNKDYNINYQLCWKPSNYDRSQARYTVDNFVGVGMWPNTCTGSVGSCTYVPILNTWHYHTNPGNELYICVKVVTSQNFTYYTREIVGHCPPDSSGICLPIFGFVPHTCTMNAPGNYMAIDIASPGCYAICHK